MRSKELKDLVISALLLALAFGIAFSGGFPALFEPDRLLRFTLMSVIAVSLGLVLHELQELIARNSAELASRNAKPPELPVVKAADDSLLTEPADVRGFAGREDAVMTKV